MELNELRLDLARSQKMGLHFILAAILIWTLILVTQLVDVSLWQQNMFAVRAEIEVGFRALTECFNLLTGAVPQA